MELFFKNTCLLYHKYIISESISFIQQIFIKITLPPDTGKTNKCLLPLERVSEYTNNSHTVLSAMEKKTILYILLNNGNQRFLLSAIESAKRKEGN